MSQRITDSQKNKLRLLQANFGIKIERSIDGFKILGLNNGTEPRGNSLDCTIALAESIISKNVNNTN